MAKAAFFERTSNVVQARDALTAWASREDKIPFGDLAAALFGDELQQRVSWYRGKDRASREAALARRYLDRGDFVRAAIYGQESLITAEVAESHGDPNKYEDRNQARERLRENAAFREFGQLRNALANGGDCATRASSRPAVAKASTPRPASNCFSMPCLQKRSGLRRTS